MLEALCASCGAIPRRGSVNDGSTVGYTAPEARSLNAVTELGIGYGQYLEDSWSFIDAPGNIEFSPDARYACMVADLAIVVVEPEAAKAMAAGPILKFLDDHDIPHVVVINKIERKSVV